MKIQYQLKRIHELINIKTYLHKLFFINLKISKSKPVLYITTSQFMVFKFNRKLYKSF
jgi:hypothetical protein